MHKVYAILTKHSNNLHHCVSLYFFTFIFTTNSTILTSVFLHYKQLFQHFIIFSLQIQLFPQFSTNIIFSTPLLTFPSYNSHFCISSSQTPISTFHFIECTKCKGFGIWFEGERRGSEQPRHSLL